MVEWIGGSLSDGSSIGLSGSSRRGSGAWLQQIRRSGHDLREWVWPVRYRSAVGWLLVLECWLVCVLSVNGSGRGRLGFVLCEGREGLCVFFGNCCESCDL